LALTPGTRLGPYEILSAIGSGGMGEVYRARDAKLGRDVAIKVLPESLADDRERLARFSREAQVLAALNHPNIAHIHGFEDSTGVPALVMEMVEGSTLADRISKGPMPIDEALAIAKQIAEALEAAHEQGIIHRDLKPANIKVRDDGTVKVLDFGLAKALETTTASSPNVTQSPTITSPAMMTGIGMILGTAAYMSPEQAKGRPADKRSDVWAFGCVLYEMLTNRRAFEGDDVSDVLATVLKTDPDWSAFGPEVPTHIRTIVRGCLTKDRKARIGDISTVRFVMHDALAVPDAASAHVAPVGRGADLSWKLAAVLFLVTTVAGFAVAYVARSARPMVSRFAVFPPEKGYFVNTGSAFAVASPMISPDGRTLAFTARDAVGKVSLWIRPIDALTPQPLAGTENAAYPFWSPDSRFIGYFAEPTKLMKIAVSGGPPQTVCVQNGGRGGTWSQDGVIVFNGGQATGLQRVSSAGGQPSPFVAGGLFPSFLPDGRHVLYYRNYSGQEGSGVYLSALDGGESRRLVAADSGAVFTAYGGGYLLFVRQETLLAQRFTLNTLTLSGEPFPVVERVQAGAPLGHFGFSVSDTGVLAYGVSAGSTGELQMVWVDRQGKLINTVGPVQHVRGLDLSADGKRVAAHRHDAQGGDIWLTELTRGSTTRLTFDASQENNSPIWSPDGSRVAFGSLRNGKYGLYQKPANGSGDEERLTESDRRILPMSWSPDGLSIVFMQMDPKTGADVWLLRLTGDHKLMPFLQSPFSESHPQVSPDGKWLAYHSSETGQPEVYVQPFPSGAGKWQVSLNGGQFPRWRPDGRELFYMDRVTNGKLMSVDVRSNGSIFEAGTPRELFESMYNNLSHGGGQYHTFAVSPDGQRFLIPRPIERDTDRATTPIVVVLNWFEELKARVPAK
jgi:Tol biopolymer transport system component